MSVTNTAHDSVRKAIQKEVRTLRRKYTRIQIVEESQSKGKSINKEQQELILSKPFILTDLHCYEKELGFLRKFSKERSSSSKNGILPNHNSLDKQRRLCVAYDSIMFCLDLKKCMAYSDHKLLPLPKISAHNFSEQSNPVSMGLFKLGSGVYMVGGHTSTDTEKRWTYEVTLVDDKLCLSKCKSIRNLKKPKLRPTIVKIDNEIHVIESAPRPRRFLNLPPFPSHEVLRLDENNVGVWSEVSDKFVIYPMDACFHMVIGKRIYTTSLNYYPKFGIFDLENKEWKMGEIIVEPYLHPIRHVAQIVHGGCGICVGKFMDGPDYVVVAVGDTKIDADYAMGAAAYLVTPTGQVLCYQRLPQFFGDDLEYNVFYRGKMLRVEEEGETLCAVIEGQSRDLGWFNKESLERFLRVCTFTVEEAFGARTMVLDLGVQARRRGDEVCATELPLAVEKNFVNVVVDQIYGFKLEEDDIGDAYSHMSACFL